MTEGLACECHIPLTWHAAQPGALLHSYMREAALLLNALNQIEAAHEMDAGNPDSRVQRENRRLDRIEAKLDLSLHLLARALETDDAPPARGVQLTPSGAQWQDPAPPAQGTPLILELRPSEILPLSLKLPAIAQEPLAGNARVSFDGLSEALDDALYQFVFRRHRQAIRARSV
jgi:hypothetical protein